MKMFLKGAAGVLAALGLQASPVLAETDDKQTAPVLNATLDDYQYPFEVKRFDFESQGQTLQMSYMHLPARNNKPTVVLLHGKNFNGAYWKSTAKYLSARGYGVVMPDQIGFGKSSKPTDYQYSFNQLALNSSDLLDHLGLDDVILVGHSMGGMLASRFALSYPDRTRSLILINPIGLEDYLDYTEYPDMTAAYERELSKTGSDIVNYQKANYYAGAWSEDYAALTVPLIGWQNGPDKEQIARVSALTYDMILTQPVIDDFDNLSVPTSFIIGTRDTTGPNRANLREGINYTLGQYDVLGDRAAARVKNSKLIELEGLGHLPHIEDFDTFAPALDLALSHEDDE